MACNFTCKLLLPRLAQVQPHRSRVVMSRIYPPVPPTHHQPINYNTLKEENFVYKAVENHNLVTIPEIECILTTHVDNLGSRGQVVMVNRGMFRKFLYPTGAAVYASPENLQEFKDLDEDIVAKTPHALQTYRKLCGLNLPIKMNHFKPWTLSRANVIAAFRHVGIHIENEDCVTLPNEPITNTHSEQVPFQVKVTVNGLDEATVNCYKEPYTTNVDRQVELPETPDLPLHRPVEEVDEELRKKGLYYGTTVTV